MMRHHEHRIFRGVALAGPWLVLAGCAYSASGSSHRAVSVRPSVQSIRVELEKRTVDIKLEHTVDGYEANCDGNWLIVGGKSTKFNAENPQASNLKLIDLRQLKIKSALLLDKGIHDVSYAETRGTAIIWTVLRTLLDLESVTTMAPAEGPETNIPLEACEPFAHKSFRKYAP
jgi:hypothetical protein